MRRVGRFALDALLPPQCLSCRTLVAEPGGLCADCWAALHFVGPPFCARCGLPFEVDAGPEALCGACLETPPAFARARAVLRYDAASRGLVLGLKHGDRTDRASAFAAWMRRAGAGLLDDADVIAPVPLHWRRLFARRYNQSALLALGLGRRCGVPVVPDLVVRLRPTVPQGKLTAHQRHRNVSGVFAVHPRRAAALKGRRVLLVDDVQTTGATVEACARVLASGGARSVDVLTLARAFRTGA
jgi:ComF family protein